MKLKQPVTDGGIKELERQYDSALYERLILSRDKEGIERLSTEGQIIEKPEDLLKDPYVLEFTGLPELAKYSETDLETKIIDHLQEFLLELGRGFTFVGRQVRFTFEDENPTIGILLCKNKNDAVVEMTLPENNNRIFACKYLTVLPSKEKLKKLMESEE